MSTNSRYSVLFFALIMLIASAAHALEPIKFGAIVPLNDAIGKQSANAMKLAVKEINKAGGIIGRSLELIVSDDEMNAEKGAAAVDKLATADKVDFFVGGFTSGVHLAQIPVMKKYGKITLWSGAASARCERALADQDWYFHLHPWDYQQAKSQFEGWLAINAKHPEVKVEKWFFAYEDGAFGTMSYKAVTDLLPPGWTQQGANFKSATQGGSDYGIALKRAKEAKPDAFLWIGFEADAMPIMTQAKEMGFYPPISIGSFWPVDFGKHPLSENAISYGMWTPVMKNLNKASRSFSEAYKKEFGEDASNHIVLLSYSSIYILAEAIKKAGNLDSKALIAALEQTKYESPLGDTISFKPSNIIKHQGLTKSKIFQWQNGVQQVIWPFEFATAKLNYPNKP
ncbi:MAG: hypothetical protein BWY57_00036 [Betaproteobacteria bacterium ADurb.Bin341]|nr:MAG: hypothetical protein BWY57_00036 [Betaproteobacteria bacterium ADurb.Bin341]